MTMDSIQLVRRAIRFQGPERIPLWLSPEEPDSDLISCGAAPAKDQPPRREGEDEWGSLWWPRPGQPPYLKEGALADWSKAADYQFPDPWAPGRFDGVPERRAAYPDKYAKGGVSFWERLWRVRGLHETMEDLIVNPDRVEWLADHLVDFNLALIEQYAEVGVDGIMFVDDWGIQDALWINPVLWRKLFKPRYWVLFDRIHDLGMDVLLHTCGWVWEIIPDFIEVGLNAFHFNQPNLMGIDRLSQEFGGKVCFICQVDIQTTLAHGTIEQVRQEAHHLIEAFGRFYGGFVGMGGDFDPVVASEANRQAAVEAFKEFGGWTGR